MNSKLSKAVIVALMSLSGAAMANPPQANANAAAGASATGVGISSNHNSVTGYTSGYAIGNANSAYGVGGNATAVSGQGGTGFGTALSAPTQTVNVGGTPAQQTITHSGRSYVENVPNVMAPGNWPTAPCMGSSSVGAGWVGFGFSGGSSWTDKECQLMEVSRQAPTVEDKVFVWCKAEAAKGSPSCKKFEAAGEVKATPTAGAESHDRKTVAASREWWEQQ